MSKNRPSQSGLARSASLLRALGAHAGPVWAELPPEDAAAISDMIDSGAAKADTAAAAATALLEDAGQISAQVNTAGAQQTNTIWAALSNLPTAQLAPLLQDEHPQVIALALTRLTPQAAASLVRQFPALLARDVLHRMLHMAPINAAALTAIETGFRTRINAIPSSPAAQPDTAVARIFDALPADLSADLLAELQDIEPGASARIRALMFTFADLATLSPAGMQTLLSKADRATLILALKGVSGEVADAFFTNMTSRAGEVMREEITALGPKPRASVEDARAAIVGLTRTLLDAGDIRANRDIADEDLIA